MRYCDAHCHTNTYTNPEELISYCSQHKIDIISVSVDIDSYNYCKNRKIKNLAIGIHPTFVNKINENDFEYIENEIKNGFCSMIGEIGLDFGPGNITFRDTQIQVLIRILSIAEKYRIPVNIHSYRAVKEILEILDSYKNFNVLLHWFTGNKTELTTAVDRGYFIGITPSVLKSKNIQNIVLNSPLENLITESDSPINKWTPLDIPKIVEKIAEIKKLSLIDVIDVIYGNYINYIGVK